MSTTRRGAARSRAALVLSAGVPLIVAYILGLGLITFLVFGYDKLQAIRKGRRVPEQTLLLLSLAGGALGGWAGMLVWRHKINHPSYWICQVVGTIAIVAALLLV